MPESEVVSAILRVAASCTSEEELLQELIEVSMREAASDSCDVLFRDINDGLVLRASTLVPEMTNRMYFSRGLGLVGAALVSEAPVLISNHAHEDPRYQRYPGLDAHETGAIAVFPLRSTRGNSFGVLVFRRRDIWPFTPKVQKRLATIAETFAHAYTLFRAGMNPSRRRDPLGALSEVTRNLTASPYLDEVLQLLVNMTAKQFNYKVCTVRLLDETHKELVLRATQATVRAYQRKRAIRLGESIAGRALEEGRPVIVEDVQVDDEYIGHDLAVEQGLRSMICVPLFVLERPVGVLSCYTEEVHEFSEDEIRALETLAQQAALAIEHSKLQVRGTLMQEMNHRVKNNLQQVAGLLRLQMRSKNTKTLEEALSDVLTRILTISAVHDLLSRDDLDHVGIRSIAESLVHHHTSLITPDKEIRFQVNGDDARLKMSQATQFALILNELISNAIEHGFLIKHQGNIHVNVELLHPEADRPEIGVWVSNDGDALPPGFDASQATSLGLQIVNQLSKSMGGTATISSKEGWTVNEVIFPHLSGE